VGLNAPDYIHEEDQPAATAALHQALKNSLTLLPNFRFRTKQGTWRWLECTITNRLENDAILGYVTNSRDVTKQVEEELRHKNSQAHYESLFYYHPDAVFELYSAGFFCKINKQVSEITGYDEAQVLSAHFREFVHDDYLPLAMDAFMSALGGNPSTWSCRLTNGTGGGIFKYYLRACAAGT
jgi:PAS domain-containing protein